MLLRSQSESTERCHGGCKEVESHDKVCQNKPLYDEITKYFIGKHYQDIHIKLTLIACKVQIV